MSDIEISATSPVVSNDPEYVANFEVHHAAEATEAHLRALVEAAIPELRLVSQWSAVWFEGAGGHATIRMTFRAPSRKEARDWHRLALLAVQRANGKASRSDRCGVAFVRNFQNPMEDLLQSQN